MNSSEIMPSWRDFLPSAYSSDDSKQDKKFHWRVFNVLVSIHIAYITFFAFLHYFKSGKREFITIISISLGIIIIRLLVDRVLSKKLAYNLFLCLALIHIFRLVYAGGEAGSNLYWLAIYPMAPFLLLSVKGGIRFNIIIGLFLIVLFSPIELSAGKYIYPAAVKGRFLMCFVATFIFSYFYEATRVYIRRRSEIYLESLEESQTQLINLSYTDGLTGCYNRHYLHSHISGELKRSGRYHHPLSIMLCDIDFFKKVNDTHGHQTGDCVLKRLGEFLNTTLRTEIDWIVRFGGEEFIIILPHTGCDGAFEIAERIRKGFSLIEFSGKTNEPLIITMSIGVVTIEKDNNGSSDFEALYKVADTNLYRAKENGRNQTVATEMSF